MSFNSLGLSDPLLKAISDKGYEQPSPIQLKAIPAILSGRDVMAMAQTGTGKTAGFTLPLLQLLAQGPKVQSNQVRALVLTPTRELAAQVAENVQQYSKYLPLKSAVVFGGVKINPQMQKLRSGVDILVATPGRLLDLFKQNALQFKQLEVLILDEADRMLDMGFIHDIRRIIALLPPKRQNLMFSATFSGDINTLAKSIVKNPIEVAASPKNTTAVTIEQCVHPVDKNKKSALLCKLIVDNNWQQVDISNEAKLNQGFYMIANATNGVYIEGHILKSDDPVSFMNYSITMKNAVLTSAKEAHAPHYNSHNNNTLFNI